MIPLPRDNPIWNLKNQLKRKQLTYDIFHSTAFIGCSTGAPLFRVYFQIQATRALVLFCFVSLFPPSSWCIFSWDELSFCFPSCCSLFTKSCSMFNITYVRCAYDCMRTCPQIFVCCLIASPHILWYVFYPCNVPNGESTNHCYEFCKQCANNTARPHSAQCVRSKIKTFHRLTHFYIIITNMSESLSATTNTLSSAIISRSGIYICLVYFGSFSVSSARCFRRIDCVLCICVCRFFGRIYCRQRTDKARHILIR